MKIGEFMNSFSDWCLTPIVHELADGVNAGLSLRLRTSHHSHDLDPLVT